MTSKLPATRFAHTLLNLALIFMILEVLWIGKLWSDKMSNEVLITSYCLLLIGSMISQHYLLKSLWGWLFTFLVLFFYSGFSVPEGLEDSQEILRNLFNEGADRDLQILRLVFTLFLFIPFFAFFRVALMDVRDWHKNRSKRRDAADQPHFGQLTASSINRLAEQDADGNPH